MFDLSPLNPLVLMDSKFASIKKYWDIVGNDIVKYVTECLKGYINLSIINTTFIMLISMKPNLSERNHFQPISLCNVIYKFISKLLSNRLKCVIDKLISEIQSAFLKGGLISDNILLAHELFHHMRTHNRKKAMIVLELDMNKAYNKVEWEFLLETMKVMGFSPQ